MSYILETTPIINMPLIAHNSVIEELMQNYTYGAKWNIIRNLKDDCITMGNYKESNRGNAEFVINVTDDGVYIEGCDYSATMRGFLTFLEKIKYSANEDYFYIENCCVTENPLLTFRCVHLCIFPETKLDFLKKCVRSCAIAKYSHIIFEFWGMLKFDCMKELSWPFAYNKEEIKKIVGEANALGVEIIPMFNHLGHASACREVNGKHVVLDQKPQMEYLFESYGWVWNLKRDDVRSLLSKVREELIDICGEGKYFHVGCDEAYSYAHNAKNAEELAEYINTVCADLLSKGRRMIMWHDMLLSPDEFKDYVAFSDKDVSEILLEKLNKKIIIADWEYYREFGCSWKTSKELKKHGFDVLCCPWYQISNIHEAIETVLSNGLYGVIITTWNTLQCGFREMIYAGACAYDKKAMGDMEMQRIYCSHVARKALPSYGEYEKCGWSEKMTGPGL